MLEVKSLNTKTRLGHAPALTTGLGESPLPWGQSGNNPPYSPNMATRTTVKDESPSGPQGPPGVEGGQWGALGAQVKDGRPSGAPWGALWAHMGAQWGPMGASGGPWGPRGTLGP